MEFFDDEERFMSSMQGVSESDSENTLRPKSIDEYVGQEKIKENLDIYIKAAVGRDEAWTTCFCTVLPDLERRRLRISSQAKWARKFVSRRDLQ